LADPNIEHLFLGGARPVAAAVAVSPEAVV